MVHNFSDYPTCAIQVISKNQDTLHIVSQAQGALMQPWRIFREQAKEYLVYMPKISKWFGDLLNENEGYSNKNRLLGKEFEVQLMERLGVYLKNLLIEPYHFILLSAPTVNFMPHKIELVVCGT